MEELSREEMMIEAKDICGVCGERCQFCLFREKNEIDVCILRNYVRKVHCIDMLAELDTYKVDWAKTSIDKNDRDIEIYETFLQCILRTQYEDYFPLDK